uniref:NYN domain-containing protein n=1 Tax=Tetranychus urticae TaxID=32264 RepID=T1KGJ9_TETUR
MLSGLEKPCGIFWDIENVDVPRNCAADVIAQNIRATLVFPNQLVEREFFCVCNVHQLPKTVGTSLESIGVTIVQPFYNIKENAADTKILLLISKFIQNWGRNGCAIVVVTGDSDFLDPLLKLKLNHDLTVYLIHPKQSFSRELLWSADFSYQLDGVLLIETTPTAVFRSQTRSGFLKISDLPQDSESHNRVREINRNCARLFPGSRVLKIAKGTVWIGYINPNQPMTENEFKILSSLSQVSNLFPKLEIVKSLWSESSHKTRHRQLKNGEQSLSGDNPKNKDNQVRTTVPVFQEIKPSSPRAKLSKSSNRRISARQPVPNLSRKEVEFRNLRKMIICLTGNPNSELPTHWSLMYNIVDKSLDHSIMKVMLQGKDFWVQFEDEIKCQQLVDKIISDANYLSPLIMKKSISPSKKLVAIMSSYPSDNPFCLNLNLGLNYLKSSNPGSFTDSTADQSVEKIKSISASFKGVFVKLFEGTIWAGFPSIRTCENAKKKINGLKDDKLHMQSAQLRMFPVHLLESIGMKDLVGEAQDLVKTWLSRKQSTPTRMVLQSESPIREVSVSKSIESNADSVSVISEKIDANRHNVPCSSEVDGKSSSTYMETVSSVHGYFLQISDILQLQRKRFLRKPFIIQNLVDFVGIPPKAAILDDNAVYFNYNTVDEVKRAVKVIESKLYDNVHQLKAISVPEAPSNWLKKKKYYFGLPRVPPQPPKKSITYISIAPVARKEMKTFNSIALGALQSFYVYFIRHFDESLWIGIGTQEQAEEAVKIFKENNVFDAKLDIKIVKKLPKEFWRTVKEGKQSPSETIETASSKATSENGSMKSLSELSSATSILSLQKPLVKNEPFVFVPHQTSTESTIKRLDAKDESKRLTNVSKPAPVSPFTTGFSSQNGTKNTREKPYQFVTETKGKLGPILNLPQSEVTAHRPLSSAPAIPKAPSSTANRSDSTDLHRAASDQLKQKLFDSFYYLMINTSQSFITDEALSIVKNELRYCVLIKQLNGSIFAVFNDFNKRTLAKEVINGYFFADTHHNTYFCKARILDKAPDEFVKSLSRSEVYELWTLSKATKSSQLNVAQNKPAPVIDRSHLYSSADRLKTTQSQTQGSNVNATIMNTRIVQQHQRPTISNQERAKKKGCVVS